MTDLDRLDVLAAAATPGPWKVFEGYDGGLSLAMIRSTDRQVSIIGPENAEWPWVLTDANAAFIAACDPATIRSLVAAVRERDELRAAAGAVLRAVEWRPLESGNTKSYPVWNDSESIRLLRAALHREDGS